MEITLKNYQIINAEQSIGELMAEKLPTKVSWNINKNMKKINIAFKNYLEFENKLVEKYALKDDKGSVILDEQHNPKFPPKNKSEYISERNELLNCEDTIEILQINLSDLENTKISAVTLLNLEFMINDDL